MCAATAQTVAVCDKPTRCRWKNDYDLLEGVLQLCVLVWMTMRSWVERKLGLAPLAGPPVVGEPGSTMPLQEALDGLELAQGECEGGMCDANMPTMR